jgi:AcrR family transcriptional regulator
MPAARLDDDALLDRLTAVFQRYGYEGASLTRLCEATGLQRASLYHRFPGGKEQMAEAVLERTARWLETHVLEPLRGAGSPEQRVRQMARQLDAFYQSGERSCLLDTLSLGDPGGPFRAAVRATVESWLAAMEKVARDAGISRPAARRLAEEALVRIEGSLVVARTTGSPGAFRRTLEGLPALLTRDREAG